MSAPTPRTDAATYPADCLGTELVTHRDCSRALERELVALTAERDQLRAERDSIKQEIEMVEHRAYRAEVERDQLRAEVERLSALGSWAHTCIHHIDEERKAWAACPCCAIARAERAEADAERYRLITLRQDADLAAERARLDWVFRNCKVISDGYPIHDREDLGAAMQEGAK